MKRAPSLSVLRSETDQSVNFVEEHLAGFLESRFVRRADDYFICYLSSHSGCNRGCKFCHLTTTGQTSFSASSMSDFVIQANRVFSHYRQEKATARPAKYMHFDFMSRGEPLANPVVANQSLELFGQLSRMSLAEGLPVKFNVSTIFPNTFKHTLVEAFPVITPTIYYSLYSMDADWRAKWLPTAMDPWHALALLKEYYDFSRKVPKIHYAFIAGENDHKDDVQAVLEAVDYHLGSLVDFNIVSYNPASPDQGKESSQEVIVDRVQQISNQIKGRVKVVSRVGYDVKASCGMFVNGEEA